MCDPQSLLLTEGVCFLYMIYHNGCMNFDELGNSHREIEISENRVDEKGKIIEDLTSFSVQNDNPLYFEDFGLDDDSVLIKNTKIKKEVLEGLEKKVCLDVENAFLHFKSFLRGPIFTDSFHQNHVLRREWEKKIHEIDPKVYEYYQSNRLNTNRYCVVESWLSILEKDIINPDIKNKLSELKRNIPIELKGGNKNGGPKYSELKDSKKVKAIKEISEIVKQAILLLEDNSD